MANIYVRNAGSNTSPYDTWAKAATTMASALAIATNADTIWVADDHAETYTGDTTWTLPTSPGLRILAANTHATEPPTGLSSSSATITTTTNAADLIINGFAYFYGLEFNYGDSTDQCLLQIASSNGLNHGIVMEDCEFNNLPTSGTSDGLRLGAAGTNTAQRCHVKIKNALITHKSTGVSATGIGLGNGQIHIDGLTLAASSNGPTTGFIAIGNGGGCNGNYLIENFDFSNLNTSCPIVNVAGVTSGILTLRNGKLASGATLTNGTNLVSGPTVIFNNVDGADTNYRLSRYTPQGSIVSETTIVRSGGASDGTTPLSWKMVSNANAVFPINYLESGEIALWNEDTGSGKTVTVEIVHDSQGAGSGSAFQDDEIWLEVSYLGTSGYPLGTRITDRKSTVLSTATDQTSSSESWTTTGLTTPVKQKLSVTFTPQEKGFILAKVVLAKASKTVYVDPKLTIS